MLGAILLFAGIHGFCGIENADGTLIVKVGWGFSLRAIWRAIYFSVVTFTSLGYGDIQPSYAGTYVTTIEVTIGVVLIALFVGSIIRKLSR